MYDPLDPGPSFPEHSVAMAQLIANPKLKAGRFPDRLTKPFLGKSRLVVAVDFSRDQKSTSHIN